MNDRQYRRRKTERDPRKNSFCSSTQSDRLTKDHYAVKNAIDESLYAVRFNAQDARSVMSAVRSGRKHAPSKKKRSFLRSDLIFASAFLLLIALPVSLYAVRSRESITTIVASPGQTTAQPFSSFDPVSDVASLSPTAAPTSVPVADLPFAGIGESEAIRITRECFEAHCDTTIFSFDEYEISAVLSDGDAPQYTVAMKSIYNNGCSFTVILSAESGEILQYSSPQLATVPSIIDAGCAEIRAWFDEYGEHLFTWPQDAQAEFSRRYEGGTLRAAKEGEISYEMAVAAVEQTVTSETPGLFTAFYPVLYSERASSSGKAFYLVYCYASADEDILQKGAPMMISFDAATGDILSIEGNPLEHSLNIETITPSK